MTPQELEALKAKARAKLAETQKAIAAVNVNVPVTVSSEAAKVTEVSTTVATTAPTPMTTGPTTLSNAELICNKIAELQASLQAQLPNYEFLLQQIHRALLQDPDTAHILTEEQIGVICAGLCKKKNAVLIEAASKSKTRTAKITAADL